MKPCPNVLFFIIIFLRKFSLWLPRNTCFWIPYQKNGGRARYRPRVHTDEDDNISAEAAAAAICESMEREPQVFIKRNVWNVLFYIGLQQEEIRVGCKPPLFPIVIYFLSMVSVLFSVVCTVITVPFLSLRWVFLYMTKVAVNLGTGTLSGSRKHCDIITVWY